mmetsp:Transcript_3959/g.8633  ORF Transcript_3959/g.8633 Transcript_3959/m.8633 type:complete len:515 (+) Transcript_3959:415-1959(+)
MESQHSSSSSPSNIKAIKNNMARKETNLLAEGYPTDSTSEESVTQGDESDSDGECQRFMAPLTGKSNSATAGSIMFREDTHVIEVDCKYTKEEEKEIWYTRSQCDSFLKDCDEQAQKYEILLEEKQLAKLKKKPGKQPADEDSLDESIRSVGTKPNETSVCSLGLEAWTVEGWKKRRRRRKVSINAVLDEQFSAWDRGEIENREAMLTLYTNAAVSSKRSALKRGLQLQDEVEKFLLESTLNDYNRAVHTLSLLQQSLQCIKSTARSKRRVNVSPTPSTRRGSMNSSSTGNNQKTTATMKRSTSVPVSLSEGSTKSTTSIIDRAIAITTEKADRTPRAPSRRPTPLQCGLSPKSSGGPRVASLKNVPLPISLEESSPYDDVPLTPKSTKSKVSIDLLLHPPTPPSSERPTLSSGRRKPASVKTIDSDECRDNNVTKKKKKKKERKQQVQRQPEEKTGGKKSKVRKQRLSSISTGSKDKGKKTPKGKISEGASSRSLCSEVSITETTKKPSSTAW